MCGLSASAEHYLKAILQLDAGEEGARISDIAERLEVSRPSVCKAVNALEGKGLLCRLGHRVALTPLGMQRAREVESRYQLAKRFLQEVLEVDEETAERDACALEHTVSAGCLDRLGLLAEGAA